MVSAWTRNFGLSMSRSTCCRGSFISTGYESMKHNFEEEEGKPPWTRVPPAAGGKEVVPEMVDLAATERPA